MKKVEKLKLSMTMAVCFIVALFATSCGSNDIFGFEDEFFSPGYYDNERFLELSDYSDLSNLSIENLDILSEAESRLNIHMRDGLYVIKYKSGSDVNISEKLFDYITWNYNHYNSIIKQEKGKGNLRRTKSWDPEGGNDCVVFAISHYCDVPYNTVLDSLVNKPQLQLDAAVRIFKPSASYQDALSLNSESGILVVYEHVVNLEHIVKTKDNNNRRCYRVYYKDWQQYPSNGGNGLYYIVYNLDFPCLNVYGVDIIYGYVK